MNTRERLLGELDGCRWLLLRALADDADERGQDTLAAGWRWLAENRYWPSGTHTLGGAYKWKGAGYNYDRDEGRLRKAVLYRLEALFWSRVDHADLAVAAARERERVMALGVDEYRRVYVEVMAGHVRVLAFDQGWENFPPDPVMVNWSSKDLGLLLEDTALVAGQWLAALPKKRRTPAGKTVEIDSPGRKAL